MRKYRLAAAVGLLGLALALVVPTTAGASPVAPGSAHPHQGISRMACAGGTIGAAIVSGSGQSVPAGNFFPQPLVARVTCVEKGTHRRFAVAGTRVDFFWPPDWSSYPTSGAVTTTASGEATIKLESSTNTLAQVGDTSAIGKWTITATPCPGAPNACFLPTAAIAAFILHTTTPARIPDSWFEAELATGLGVSNNRIWGEGGRSTTVVYKGPLPLTGISATWIQPAIPPNSGGVFLWPGLQNNGNCAQTCLVQAGTMSGMWFTYAYPAPGEGAGPSWPGAPPGTKVTTSVDLIGQGLWRVSLADPQAHVKWSGLEHWTCAHCRTAELSVEAMPYGSQLTTHVHWLAASLVIGGQSFNLLPLLKWEFNWPSYGT